MSQKVIGSCRRHLCSKSPPQSRKGPTTIFVIAVALMIPPTMIKVFDVQLDPPIENIVGTLFGTNAVLYLRPSPGRPFSDTVVKDVMAFIKGETSAVLDTKADQTDESVTLEAPRDEAKSDENLVTDIVELDMELKSDVASITEKEIIGEEHLIEVDTPIQISEFTSSKIEECPVASKIGK